MPNFVSFGSLIRYYRKKSLLSIEKLAELCDVSPRCISDIERNVSIPGADTFIAICRALDICDIHNFYQFFQDDESTTA